MTAAVLFPWSRGCPHRDAAAAWVTEQWTRHHPGIPQHTTGDAPHLAAGPWSKGRHIAALLDHAPNGIVVISDVDVWTTPDAIRAAITAVENGSPWAVPHGDVYRLTQAATADVLDGGMDSSLDRPARLDDLDLVEPPDPGHTGGGIVVIPAATARQIPLDPRFEGWGQEDDSWALALHTLAGEPWRDRSLNGGRVPLIHLWHPPQPRLDRYHGSRASVALYRRYLAASHHPDAMRALIAETRQEA